MITDNENLGETEKSLHSDSYENTLVELKDVLKSIENQEDNLDNLLVNVKHANELVLQCREKLRSIENSVNQIL